MSPDPAALLIAILAVGVGMAGLTTGLFAWLRSDVRRSEERLNGRMDRLDARLDRMEDRLGGVERELAEVKGKLTFVERYILGRNEASPEPAE